MNDALRIRYSDPVDPWEELDTPWGRMSAWKAATYATGSAEAAINAYQQVRNDSAAIVARQNVRDDELKARSDALSARERKVAVDAAVVSELMGRVGKAIDWIERQKADAEEKPLPLPPGHKSEEPAPSLHQQADAALPGDPSPPSKMQDATENNLPGGATGEPNEDDPTTTGDHRGKSRVTKNETEFPDPSLPHPPVVKQPIVRS
jgi:hypothetical protein